MGSGDNHAYGVIIAGGHTLALFLTLLATPVAYSLLDDLTVRFSSKARLAPLVPPGAPAPAIPGAPES